MDKMELTELIDVLGETIEIVIGWLDSQQAMASFKQQRKPARRKVRRPHVAVTKAEGK